MPQRNWNHTYVDVDRTGSCAGVLSPAVLTFDYLTIFFDFARILASNVNLLIMIYIKQQGEVR